MVREGSPGSASSRLWNQTTRYIPSSSPVLSRFTSSFTCQAIFVIIATLSIHHSFTLSLQAGPSRSLSPRHIFTFKGQRSRSRKRKCRNRFLTVSSVKLRRMWWFDSQVQITMFRFRGTMLVVPYAGDFFCRAMLCKRDLCRHAVSVYPSVCLSVGHVCEFCRNE